MSLNGLDTPEVQEAYQQAILEPGGWFLLKYITRDSVALHGRGKGGVHEARVAIAKYEDASPLYGVVIYRRRKVLVKYIPEGTTRLLQARTAVHFQDVTDRFVPYETLVELSTAEGLSDTTLAASFPLHTASPATSSSRLHEISEDGEYAGPTPRVAANPTPSTGPMFGTQRYRLEKRVDLLMGPDRPTKYLPFVKSSSETMSAMSPPISSAQKPSISQFLVRDDSGQRSVTSLGSHPAIRSMTDLTDSEMVVKIAEEGPAARDDPEAHSETDVQHQHEQANGFAPPSLTQDFDPISHSAAEPSVNEPLDRPAERPALAEPAITPESRLYDDVLYDFSKFDLKPKVKLGPRPVVATDRAKRPMVASVPTLPATYRPTQKRPTASRANTEGPVGVFAHAPPVLPRPPPIPNTPEYNPRPVSRGSVKSAPSHKSTTITPDKLRLMKAVELRRKQLRKSTPQPSTSPQKPKDPPVVPAVPDMQPLASQVQPHVESHIVEERWVPSHKADSGIEMSYEQLERQGEEHEVGSPKDEAARPVIDLRVPAGLDPTQPLNRQALKLNTDRPSSTGTGPHDQPMYPSGILEEPPTSVLALSGNLPTTDSPTLGRLSDGPRQAIHQHYESSQVPTIVMADGSRPLTSDGPRLGARRGMITREGEGEGEDSSDSGVGMTGRASGDLSTEEQNRTDSSVAKRRRGIVEPLQIDPLAEGDFDSDDDFYEELQSATLQKAKPFSVAGTPVTSAFGRSSSGQSASSDKDVPAVRSINIRRSSSNLLDHFLETTDRTTDMGTGEAARSKSVSTLPVETESSMPAMKRKVSEGIAGRIQSLTGVSNTESPPNETPRPATPEIPPENTWRGRKSLVRSPPGSRTSSYKAVARRSGRHSGQSILGVNTASEGLQPADATWNVHHDPASNRSSVSVTARIVRPSPSAERRPSHLDGSLQQSQLLINHRRTSSSTSGYDEVAPSHHTSTYLAAPRNDSTPSISLFPNITPTSTNSMPEYRTMHSASRKSLGRHRQGVSPVSITAEDFPPPPMSPVQMASPTYLAPSRASTASSTDEHAGSRDGRTSRFFKRISNLGGHRRKSSSSGQRSAGATSTTDLTSLSPRNASVIMEDYPPDPPHAVAIGNLNVQFPDSLLWKRRSVTVDDAGYLLFSIPQAMDIQKLSTKKYHLSGFRMPYAPDLDRQELPHSVMLDFADGQTALQVACEDALTRRQVLHTLKSCWRAWESAG